MTHPRTSRRSVLALGATGALATTLRPLEATAARRGGRSRHHALDQALAELERSSGRTIGVAAGDGVGIRYRYRGLQRFPMCSLFKTLLVGALLREHAYDDRFWQRRIRFSAAQVVVNSPVCQADADGEMSVAELADAALRFSDNTAGNLLLELAGGPPAVTAFAAGLGAHHTRLDRWEPELNEGLPGDPRDTSTPADLHRVYSALLVGDALDRLGQARLRDWMLRNATSGERLRQALPSGAELADKTGAGDYGVVNDAGVFWRGEDVLSAVVMTRTEEPGATNDNRVVARVGELLVQTFLR